MKKLEGLITALITPFKDQQIDFSSLEKLLEFQLTHGVEGFVVNGTTAESPTLTSTEVEKLFAFVEKSTMGKVPLILGTGTNSTNETIVKTKKAADLGAVAALVVVPYYNKPPQRGLLQHFESVADSSPIPIVLYNVPGRTIISLEVDTVVALSKNKNIIGIKEASGKKEIAQEIRQKCPKDFILLSGDDGTYLDFLEAGGDGIISVASHIIPQDMKRIRDLVLNNENAKAHELMRKLLPLIDYLFIEANPIPLKKALQLQKIIDSAELRLPLVELDPRFLAPLTKLMKEAGLIL